MNEYSAEQAFKQSFIDVPRRPGTYAERQVPHSIKLCFHEGKSLLRLTKCLVGCIPSHLLE